MKKEMHALLEATILSIENLLHKYMYIIYNYEENIPYFLFYINIFIYDITIYV